MLTIDITAASVQRTLLPAHSSRSNPSKRAFKSRFDVLNACWECVRLASEHGAPAAASRSVESQFAAPLEAQP
jgi:hypothetical protein